MPEIQTAAAPASQRGPSLRPPLSFKRKAHFAAFMAGGTATLMLLLVLGFYAAKAYAFHQNLASKFQWEGDSFVRDDAELGYVPRANSAVRFRLPLEFSVYSDNRGGRVERAGMTAPARADVLTVGCSFTWGHGVDEGDTYARILKDRTELEVYNIGVASYGTTTTLLYMKRFADLQPKVIVYGFIDDHLIRSLRPTASSICPYIRPVPFVDFNEQDQPKIHGPVGDTKLHDQYLREVVFDHRFGWKDISWAMYTDYLRVGRKQTDPFLGASDAYVMKKIDNFNAWNGDPAKIQKMLNFLVAQMTAEAKRNGAKLVIAYLPTRELASAPAYLVKAVEAAQAPETVYLVDTSPILQKLAEKGIDTVFLKGDSHPGPQGHAAIAEAIEPLVRKLAGR
jgi:hypothetical protein